ncbi:MAG: hypothetical protein V4772_08695 [Pseudomonadota bacterium]
MPVVAVAAAVFSGIEIATVGLAAMSAFEVVAAVGAIASGIGAVTGNETLMKVGGLASLAGGVGSIASGKGLFGMGAAESGVNGADLMSDQFTASGATGAGGFSGASLPASPITGVATPDAVTSTTSPAAEAAVTPMDAAGTTASPITAPSPIAGQQTGLLNQPTGAAPADLGLPSETLTPGASPALSAAKDSQLANQQLGANALGGYRPTSATASGGIFDKLKDFGKFAKDNKELVSLGGNFVGGLFDKNKAAQTELYNARTASEILQADIARQQQSNANAVPNMQNLKVSNKNIFPSGAPTYTPPRVGLINSVGR